jgi:hypothetical protein
MEHNIINTGDYLLIVDDNSIMATKGQWVLETHNYTNPNTISEISGDWDCNRNGYKDKIILAHLPLNNSPILEGVDLLPELTFEDEVDKLADELYLEKSNRINDSEIRGYIVSATKGGFIDGYNKAKEKYKYIEFDIIKAFEYGWNQRHYGKIDENELLEIQKIFIQSLQQQKMPVGFKCEMIGFEVDMGLGEECIEYSQYPKTLTMNGMVLWVGKYIY